MKLNNKYLIVLLLILIIFALVSQYNIKEGVTTAPTKPTTPKKITTIPSPVDFDFHLRTVQGVLNGTIKINGFDTPVPSFKCVLPGYTLATTPVYSPIINDSTKIGFSYNDCYQAIMGLGIKIIGDKTMVSKLSDPIPYASIYIAHIDKLYVSISTINKSNNDYAKDTLKKIIINYYYLFVDEQSKINYHRNFNDSFNDVISVLRLIFNIGNFSSMVESSKQNVLCAFSAQPLGDGQVNGYIAYIEPLLREQIKNISYGDPPSYQGTPPPLYVNNNPPFITDIISMPSSGPGLDAIKNNYKTSYFDNEGNRKSLTGSDGKKVLVPLPGQIRVPDILPPPPTPINK